MITPGLIYLVKDNAINRSSQCNPPILLTKRTFAIFILISVKCNLSSHIWSFFYMRRLAIEMHCTRTHKVFIIDQHPGNNYVLFIELFTNRHVSAIKKNNLSVFLFQLLQFDYRYEIWEIFFYFTTCFSFWRLFYSLPTFCIKYLDVGHIFFCWRLQKYELLQLLWY